MPPLRERRDEIPHLTDFFIDRYAQRYNRPVRAAVATSCGERFQTYDWPGNIRELENMIKRFVILQDEQLVVREMLAHAAASSPHIAGVAAASARTRRAASAPPRPATSSTPPADDETRPTTEVAVAAAPARTAAARGRRARRPR